MDERAFTTRRRLRAHSRPRLLSRLRIPPARFLRDRRGTVLAQTVVLLPLFILVVLGGYEILRVMSIKQALHQGTYQAARYLALNPIMAIRPGPWEDVAEQFVLEELKARVGERDARLGLVRVRVRPPGNIPPCGWFTVESYFNWEFDVPFAKRFRVPLREEYRVNIVKCF